jgi:enamine deaminase RidA (YjgF/YER057c/UK114 family)
LTSSSSPPVRVLTSAGLSFPDIIKVTLYLTSSEFLEPVDSIYQKYFDFPDSPARTIIIIPALPGGMGIEIEAIALRG